MEIELVAGPDPDPRFTGRYSVKRVTIDGVEALVGRQTIEQRRSLGRDEEVTIRVDVAVRE